MRLMLKKLIKVTISTIVRLCFCNHYKKVVMKNIYQILLFFLIASSYAQTEITKELNDFTELKVFNGIQVELIKSTEQKIEISGKKAANIDVNQAQSTLRLQLPFSIKPEENNAGDDLLIKLYYNKKIDIIDANENATITGKDFTQTEVTLKTQEKAFINLVLNVEFLKLKATSGGIIKVSGTAKTQEIDADLYGVVNAYNLITEHNCIVRSASGAKVEVFVSGKLDAKVSFGGSIFYKGTPKILEEKKVVGGIIQNKN